MNSELNIVDGWNRLWVTLSRKFPNSRKLDWEYRYTPVCALELDPETQYVSARQLAADGFYEISYVDEGLEQGHISFADRTIACSQFSSTVQDVIDINFGFNHWLLCLARARHDKMHEEILRRCRYELTDEREAFIKAISRLQGRDISAWLKNVQAMRVI